MILDIIATVIVFFCIVRGIKNGFVKAFFGTATLIIALVLTFFSVGPVFEYAKNTSLGEAIYEKTQIEFIDEEDFEQAKEFLDKFGIGEINMADKAAGDVLELEENLSLNIGNAAIKALCSAVLFVLYFIIIKIVAKLLDLACKLPVLKTFNKAGGFLAGIVNAYIVMNVITCIIMLLLSTDAGDFLTEQLDASVITAWIYSTNPLI